MEVRYIERLHQFCTKLGVCWRCELWTRQSSSFFISFIAGGSWILIVSTKIQLAQFYAPFTILVTKKLKKVFSVAI